LNRHCHKTKKSRQADRQYYECEDEWVIPEWIYGATIRKDLNKRSDDWRKNKHYVHIAD
jgi:hypothetical protein